jgi:hypothetical protein
MICYFFVAANARTSRLLGNERATAKVYFKSPTTRMRRVVSTMAPTKREKAFCVLELAKSGSVITVQRRFRTRY